MKNINVIKKPIISMKKNLSFWDSLLKNKQPLKYNTLINFKKINIFKKKSNFQNYLDFNNKKGINKLNKSTIKIFIQNINNNNLSNNNFIFSFGKRIENYNLKRNISLPSIKDYLINSLSRSDREKDDMKIYGYRLRYTNNLDLKKKSIDETIQTKINNINYHYILKNKFLKNVYN